jgi:hypothetical protein
MEKKRFPYYDFESLEYQLSQRAETLIVDLVSGGDFNGSEYEAGSILGGSGKSFKFNIRKEKNPWSDFANGFTDSGYGFLNLYMKIKSISKQQAAHELAQRIGYIEPKQDANQRLPNFKIKDTEYIKYEYVKHWIWRDIDGVVTAATCRFKTEEINPETQEIVIDKTSRQYRVDETKPGGWDYKQPTKTKLYNLHLFNKYPDAKIVIVEGEPTVDAAQEYFGSSKVIITTWMGGNSGIKKTDFSDLKNRSVLIIPDNDSPGYKYLYYIVSKISALTDKIEYCDVEKIPDLPESWDIADAKKSDWPKDNLITTLNSVKKPAKLLTEEPQLKQAEVAPDDESPKNEVTVGNETIKPAPKNIQAIWRTLGLDVPLETQIAIANAANAIKILVKSNLFINAFVYDEFKCQRYFCGKPYSEDIEVLILNTMQTYFQIPKMSRSAVKDALDYVFYVNRKNLAVAYLDSLVWDKQPRVDKFFSYYFGAKDTNYTSAVSKNMLIAMVRRVFKPGTKFDNMVILEGSQGLLKSSGLQALAGALYYDTTNEDPSDKDFYLKLQGRMLVEIEELDSFRKAESTTLKKMLSTQTDRYRKPYAAATTDNPRTCIFVGTTNKSDYLSDSTGNRRYWPIKATKIQLDLINQDREQILAEAVYRSKTDETHWEIPMEYMDEIYSKRMNIDKDDSPENEPWYEIVAEYVKHKDEINIMKFLTDNVNPDGGLGMEISRVSKKERNAVGRILRSLGFVFNHPPGGYRKYKKWYRVTKDTVHNLSENSYGTKKMVKNYATGEMVEILSD